MTYNLNKTYGNVEPEIVERLGDKILINIEPKDISYVNENNDIVSLWEYRQAVVPLSTTQDVIDNIILTSSTDYIVRELRNKMLDNTDKKVARYRDEVELGLETTDDLAKLTNYRQYLRNIPKEEGFPHITIKTYEEFNLNDNKKEVANG